MARFITRDEANSVLPILQAHAAFHLDQMRTPGARLVAEGIRCGFAGGSEIERLEQNAEDGLPEALDNFWRVLVAFEQLALGGEIEIGGSIATVRGTIPQPYPWMLRAAGQAIRDQRSHDLADLADGYCSAQPSVRRGSFAVHA